MSIQEQPERRINQRAMWLGHYLIYALAAVVVLDIVAAATGQNKSLIGDIAGLAGGIWIAAVFASFYHDAKLCERCVAATPLDPQAAVDRWIQALRWQHVMSWRLVSLLASAAWITFLGRYTHVPPWWFWLLGVAAVPAFAFFFIADRQHRLLYPWCPFCHWDDGGDEEVAPDVPAPTVSA